MQQHAAANGSQTHGRPCRHIQSALPTGDGLWPLPRNMWWRFRKVAVFARLWVVGGLCVDMWRLVHQWSFFAVDCLLTVFGEWYTVPIVKNTQNHCCTNRHRSTKTVPTVYQRCTNRQKQSKTVKRQSKQQKWTLVYQPSYVYQDCTNSVAKVYQSSTRT